MQGTHRSLQSQHRSAVTTKSYYSDPRTGSDLPRGIRKRPVNLDHANELRVTYTSKRLKVLLIVVIGLLGLIVLRLVDLQVISSAKYSAYDRSQLAHVVPIIASRGDIVDRNGNLLAMSIPQSTIYADPKLIHDPQKVSNELASILSLPSTTILQELTVNSQFSYIDREIPNSLAKKVQALNIPGVGFLSEPKRFNPNGALAMPLLGNVGVDGTGISGLEKEFQSELAGQNGSMFTDEAPGGSQIPGSTQILQSAKPGEGLVLSLDTSIQYEVEQALASEIVQTKAKSAIAVVLDSRTGDILAMSSLERSPASTGAPTEATYNRATDMVYEPGSVMKITTFSGALTNGIISPTTKFVVPPLLNVGGTDFQDAEAHGTESLTATQIIAQSSNIGTIEIAEKLGAVNVDKYMRLFGFGANTGLGFPGASNGLLIPLSQWTGSTIGSDPIGQAASVTALQLADAMNVIANEGVFVPPKIVDATIGPDGRRTAVKSPSPHRIIPSWVGADMVSMLEQVVQNGTGTEAIVPGYSVAGKTGTAQIPNPKADGYLPGEFMATFAGFVPAQNPALTIVVSLQDPQSSVYGGSVAAPVFAQIARYALEVLGVPPSQDSQGGTLTNTAPSQSANRPLN